MNAYRARLLVPALLLAAQPTLALAQTSPDCFWSATLRKVVCSKPAPSGPSGGGSSGGGGTSGPGGGTGGGGSGGSAHGVDKNLERSLERMTDETEPPADLAPVFKAKPMTMPTARDKHGAHKGSP